MKNYFNLRKIAVQRPAEMDLEMRADEEHSNRLRALQNFRDNEGKKDFTEPSNDTASVRAATNRIDESLRQLQNLLRGNTSQSADDIYAIVDGIKSAKNYLLSYQPSVLNDARVDESISKMQNSLYDTLFLIEEQMERKMKTPRAVRNKNLLSDVYKDLKELSKTM